MPRQQKKMVNLQVEETSAVDHPAHKAEGWVVVKSADQNSLLSALEELVGTNMEETMTEEVIAEVEKMKYTDLAAANKKIMEMEAEMEKMKASMKKEEATDDDLIKSADPMIQELFAKAAAQTEELRKELAQANEEKIQKAYVEKAAKWSNLNQKAEELGSMLRKVAAVDEELAGAVERMLDSVNAQAESAEIFEELGTQKSADLGGSAFEKVQSLAKAAVVNGEFKTVEQAVAGVIAKNPSMYADYLAEQRA